MKNNRSFEYSGFTADQILNAGKLLDESEAAFCLDCSVATLQRDRHVNRINPRIPYIKNGRSVRYEPEIIKRVIESSRVGSIAA